MNTIPELETARSEARARIIVIAGPAGSGKDTIVKGALARIPHASVMVTATTRRPREGEVDGVNYYYMSNEDFEAKIADGDILEYYFRKDTQTYYGTYKVDIETRLARGDIVFAVVQIVGAKFLKESYNAATVFINPPSLEVLERRVRSRASITDHEWAERLEHTKREVEIDAPWYDYRIENEDGELDSAVSSVIEILKKEEMLDTGTLESATG